MTLAVLRHGSMNRDETQRLMDEGNFSWKQGNISLIIGSSLVRGRA